MDHQVWTTLVETRQVELFFYLSLGKYLKNLYFDTCARGTVVLKNPQTNTHFFFFSVFAGMSVFFFAFEGWTFSRNLASIKKRRSKVLSANTRVQTYLPSCPKWGRAIKFKVFPLTQRGGEVFFQHRKHKPNHRHEPGGGVLACGWCRGYSLRGKRNIYTSNKPWLPPRGRRWWSA